MAQKLQRPIEDYLIGKHDTGVCCYLITREAYHSWFNHGATVKHFCINYNGGQDLAQYPLQPKAKYKAFEFNKMPIEWQPILTKGNAELAKQLCAYHSKSKGKFDHIKPDEWLIGPGRQSSAPYFYHQDIQYGASQCWQFPGEGSGCQIYNITDKRYFDRCDPAFKLRMKQANPELYKHFEDFYAKQVAVKTEPTPDDYYIVKYQMPTWYIAKRSEYDGGAKEVPAMFWATKDGKWVAIVGTNSAVGNPHRKFKFPQLSSEIKQELQKQNPERYKEWEDFYVKKYPNMKRLEDIQADILFGRPQCGCGTCKDCLSRRPLPDPKDDYIVVDGSHGLALIKRSDYKQDIVAHNYDFNWGWQFTKVDTRGMSNRSIAEVKDYLYWDSKAFGTVRAKFEQYYTELEQKKVAEKQGKTMHELLNLTDTHLNNYAYDMSGKTPYMFYIYTVGRGFELARREAIDGINETPRPDAKVILIKVSDYSVREVDHKYITQWGKPVFVGLNKEQRANFQKQNPQLYGQWMHMIQYPKAQVGSDFDIDEKAMEADYKKQLLAAGYGDAKAVNWLENAEGRAMKNWEDMQSKLWESMYDSIGIPEDRIRGKQAKITMFEEAGPMPKNYGLHMGTPTYSAAIDPYQADFETQGVITIWRRSPNGTVVNRVSELDLKASWQGKDFSDWYAALKHEITPQDYYNLLMNSPKEVQGVAWLKPRRVGQTKFYEDVLKMAQNYGPADHAEQLMKQFEQTGYLFTNNSPNTKINNHEIINVPRKTITITSGQKCTGNTVSSFRRAPTVTEKHTGNRPQPIRGKEKPGSCKIG